MMVEYGTVAFVAWLAGIFIVLPIWLAQYRGLK